MMNLIAGVLLLATTAAALATEDYKWSYFTSMDKINALTEIEGAVYAATEGGLASVDLKYQKVVHYQKPDIPFYNNNITFTGADSSGKLFAGGATGGVAVFDGAHWTFETDSLVRFTSLKYLKTTHCIDTAGNIWFISSNQPAFFDGDSACVVSDGILSTTAPKFKSISVNDRGNLFLILDSTIYTLHGKVWVDTLRVLGLGNSATCFAAGPTSLYVGSRKGVAEITASGTVWHDKSTGAAGSDTITCLHVDVDGNLWAGTGHGCFLKKGVTWQKIDLNYCNLPDNSINLIECDSNGNIWCTAGKWICRYDGDGWTNWTLEQAGFTGSSPMPFAITATGQAVYFLSSRRLCRYYKGLWETVLDTTPTPATQLRTLVADHAGNLWLGTVNGGIIRIDGYGEKTSILPQVLDTTFSGSVWDLYVDVNNTVWFGTNNSKYGRVIGDSVQQRPTSVGVGYCTGFAVDKDGTFWLAPENNGFLADWQTAYNFFPPDSFVPSVCIFDIFIDREGKKWMASNTAGLIYGAERDNLPSQCTVFKPENSGYCGYLSGNVLTEDRQGNIWLGGRYGISIIHLEKTGVVKGRAGQAATEPRRVLLHAGLRQPYLSIHPDPGCRESEVRIYDLKGRLLLKKLIGGNEIIRLRGVKVALGGVYIVQLSAGKRSGRYRFTLP
jgi:ligand-binding sensor domain-containing protein